MLHLSHCTILDGFFKQQKAIRCLLPRMSNIAYQLPTSCLWMHALDGVKRLPCSILSKEEDFWQAIANASDVTLHVDGGPLWLKRTLGHCCIDALLASYRSDVWQQQPEMSEQLAWLRHGLCHGRQLFVAGNFLQAAALIHCIVSEIDPIAFYTPENFTVQHAYYVSSLEDLTDSHIGPWAVFYGSQLADALRLSQRCRGLIAYVPARDLQQSLMRLEYQQSLLVSRTIGAVDMLSAVDGVVVLKEGFAMPSIEGIYTLHLSGNSYQPQRLASAEYAASSSVSKSGYTEERWSAQEDLSEPGWELRAFSQRIEKGALLKKNKPLNTLQAEQGALHGLDSPDLPVGFASKTATDPAAAEVSEDSMKQQKDFSTLFKNKIASKSSRDV